jgi:hypothetical protein
MVQGNTIGTFIIRKENTCRNPCEDDLILLREDVEGVEDAGDVPQEGEQEADPELNLQEVEK